MNIIRLLLIGGLVYFAMQQKKEGTRNMVLIVTGLLAVCMLSKEGFTVDLTTRPTTCSGTKTATADDARGVVAASCTGSDNGTGSACELNAESTGCAVDGGDCSFTAEQPAINAGDDIACVAGDLDPVAFTCPAGCSPDGGGVALTDQSAITARLAEYFTGMSDVGLRYVGTGGEINAPEDLASQFQCSDGDPPTVKPGAPTTSLTGPLTTPLNLAEYLQCQAAPSGPSPSGTPSSGGPSSSGPSSSGPSSSGPSSSSPSPPGICIPGDGDTDSCGDEWKYWEWVTSTFGSPDESLLCLKNDYMPSVYCVPSSDAMSGITFGIIMFVVCFCVGVALYAKFG